MNAIVAVDQNWAIGKDGDQLCYISADLKRFKALTTDPAFTVEGAEVYHDLDALLAAAPADSFVIGGGSVYRELLPYCETVYVTKIMSTFSADTFFPDLDADPEWEVARTEGPLEENGLQFQYLTYQRK